MGIKVEFYDDRTGQSFATSEMHQIPAAGEMIALIEGEDKDYSYWTASKIVHLVTHDGGLDRHYVRVFLRPYKPSDSH